MHFQGCIHRGDGCNCGRTYATAVAPRFSDTLTLFQPGGGRFCPPLAGLHLNFRRGYVPDFRYILEKVSFAWFKILLATFYNNNFLLKTLHYGGKSDYFWYSFDNLSLKHSNFLKLGLNSVDSMLIHIWKYKTFEYCILGQKCRGGNYTTIH